MWNWIIFPLILFAWEKENKYASHRISSHRSRRSAHMFDIRADGGRRTMDGGRGKWTICVVSCLCMNIYSQRSSIINRISSSLPFPIAAALWLNCCTDPLCLGVNELFLFIATIVCDVCFCLSSWFVREFGIGAHFLSQLIDYCSLSWTAIGLGISRKLPVCQGLSLRPVWHSNNEWSQCQCAGVEGGDSKICKLEYD